MLDLHPCLTFTHAPRCSSSKAALDILVPALPRRLPPAELVKAIKWTKKIMSEEGHAVPTLLHIFQLLVKHRLSWWWHMHMPCTSI
jgi:hypothetical protein